MKLIAHRGNTDGKNPSKENHPKYNGEDFLNWDENDHNDIF